MTRPLSTVQPPSLRGTLVQHRDRIYGVEAPNPGQWIYLRPIAPAPDPPDLAPDDPDPPIFSPPVFLDGWFNDPNGTPCSFRIHPATKVAFRGDPIGGTTPSRLCQLPDGFFVPGKKIPLVFGSASNTNAYVGHVDGSGYFWIDAIVQGTSGGGGGGGSGIRFNVLNVGGWLATETSIAGSPNGYGTEFLSTAGIAIQDNSAGALLIAENGLGTIDIQSNGDIFIESDDFLEIDVYGGMEVLVYGGGFYHEDQGGGGVNFNILASGGGGAGFEVDDSSGGGINFFENGSGDISVFQQGTGGMLFNISGDGDFDFLGQGNGHFLVSTGNNSGAGGIHLEDNGTDGVALGAFGSGDILLDTTGGTGFLRFVNLPTVNPGGTNRVWRNGNVLNIT